MVRLLIAAGADVDKVNDEEIPGEVSDPMLFCQYRGEAEALLDAGVDIDRPETYMDYTCLMTASCRDYRADLVRFLVSRGADVFLTDRAGRDAESLARMRYATINANFLADVKAVGSWKQYTRAPCLKLMRLRLLCARGRATSPPDPVLARLFGAPASAPPPADKLARVDGRPLPREVVWHILGFSHEIRA